LVCGSIREMFENASPRIIVRATVTAGMFAAVLLTGCGTSSSGLTGSRHQTMTGVSETGYPAGQPVDKGSPALGSSSEQLRSDAGKPKVPRSDVPEKPVAK
jgi:hypothetical protein